MRYQVIRRGVTLIEAAMVLIIGTIIASAVVIFWGRLNDTNQIAQFHRDVMTIYSATIQLRVGGNKPAVSTLYNTELIQSGLLPASMIINSGYIKSPLNGTFVVSGNRNLIAIYQNSGVRSEDCNKIIKYDFGRNLNDIRKSVAGTTVLLSPTNRETFCDGSIDTFGILLKD